MRLEGGAVGSVPSAIAPPNVGAAETCHRTMARFVEVRGVIMAAVQGTIRLAGMLPL